MLNKMIWFVLIACLLAVVIGVACTCGKRMGKKSKKTVTFDSEYVVYGTMRCGYTVKMCEHLQKTGRTFEFVDVSEQTEAYIKELRRFGVESSGVPFVVHKPTDTYFIGFKPV